jgi:hypothetical protein
MALVADSDDRGVHRDPILNFRERLAFVVRDRGEEQEAMTQLTVWLAGIQAI